MKHYFILALSVFALVGCDAPTRTRLQPAYSNSGNNLSTGGSSSGTGTTTGWSSGGTTGSTTGSNNNLPSGFENCTFATQGYSAGLGYVGACQSTLDETLIAVKPALTDTVTRTCLIPTYKDAGGSSSYIGQPQCTYTTQNTVVQGQLLKNRTGFSNYTLNGMMIMKESSLTAYFNCMDAYIKYVSQACPMGAQTNATCDQYARNYMSQLCTTFKSQHSYIDMRLK